MSLNQTLEQLNTQFAETERKMPALFVGHGSHDLRDCMQPGSGNASTKRTPAKRNEYPRFPSRNANTKRNPSRAKQAPALPRPGNHGT